jgi:hypothetical protein
MGRDWRRVLKERSGAKAPQRPLKIKGAARKMDVKRARRREAKRPSGRLYMINGRPRGFWSKCRASLQKK